MSSIGKTASGLERRSGGFCVEALAKELPVEWISEALREAGGESVRERLLPAALTAWLVILMGLFRRASYRNLLEKIDDTWWTRGRWSPQKPPTSSAVTKARDRIGVEPMERLFVKSSARWYASTEGLMFHGRRVNAIDGSTMKTPDTEENDRRFGRPGSSRGSAAFPQMRVAALVDVGTHLIRAVWRGPYRRAEIRLARELTGELESGSLVLLDRNFLDYGLLWDIRGRGADFVVRAKSNTRTRLVRRLGPGDAIVEVAIPSYYRRKRPDMPETWILREITYRPEGGDEDIRLLTTLVDPEECEKPEIADLYHERWEEEGILDEVKTHQCDCATVNRPVVFRSKTPGRVEQELFGILLAYNLVRKIMCAAAETVDLPPTRLSFTESLERIREAAWDMMRIATARLRARYARMLKVIARDQVPERPGRHYRREVKVKMSKYPRKESGRAA